MNIIWLGHGSFRIEIEDQVLLIDPWLKDNPMLPEEHHAEAILDVHTIVLCAETGRARQPSRSLSMATWTQGFSRPRSCQIRGR